MPSMTPFYSSNDIPRAIIPPIINPSYHYFSINLSQSVIPLLFTNLNNKKPTIIVSPSIRPSLTNG